MQLGYAESNPAENCQPPELGNTYITVGGRFQLVGGVLTLSVIPQGSSVAAATLSAAEKKSAGEVHSFFGQSPICRLEFP